MTFIPSKESRVTVEMPFAGDTLTLESGWVAKQADGAVIARHGDTVVLATVCGGPARPAYLPHALHLPSSHPAGPFREVQGGGRPCRPYHRYHPDRRGEEKGF